MGLFASIPFIVKFFAMMFVSQAVAQLVKPSPQTRPDILVDDSGRGHLVNKTSTEAVKRLVYGAPRIGINWTFKGVSGTDNEYLHMVGDIGEGPIHGIVRQDGTYFTTAGTQFPTSNPPLLYLDGELWTSKSANVYCEFFAGTSSQTAPSTLTAAIPSYNDNKRYTAGIYLRLKYDKDVWVQIPEVTIRPAGLLLYDPVATTTAYSDNPALALYDMLTRPSSRGGMGLDNYHAAPPASARINATSVGSCRDYCTNAGWKVNAAIGADDYIIDLLPQLLDLYRGSLIYSESQFKMRYRDLNYETPALTLTQADVLEAGSQSSLRLRPVTDALDRPNGLAIKYLNSALNFVADEYHLADTTALSTDGDLREKTLEMLGLTDPDLVQQMAAYVLERMRWGHAGDFSAKNRCGQLEAEDLVQITHDLPGWSDQYLRVTGVGMGQDGAVGLSFEEEKLSLYDNAYTSNSQQLYAPTLPDPTDTPPNVTNATATETVYYHRGRSFTRLVVEFDPPVASSCPWWKHAEIYLQIDGGTWTYQTKSEDGYIIDPVEEGVNYAVKMRSVTIHGVKEVLDNAASVSKTITGKTAAPGNITDLAGTAVANIVELSATALTDPDLIGYEIRIGTTWETGTFVDLVLEPMARLSGISPGSKTFWMAAKNNVPKYSAAPDSVTVTVPYPTNYDYKTDWAWDFDGIGTHSNTEHCTNDTEDALKCSHTGGVLTGTWTSPTYDFSSVKRMKIYGDFRTDFDAGGDTWADKLAAATTWAANLAAGETWLAEFSTNWVGTISAVLEYGESAVNENTFNDFHNSYAEIDARYVRVVVTLTDPGSSANEYLQELNMTALTYT